jgi:acyl carrier protein phosphodiesterase
MNYLAHAFLSGNSDERLVGNLIGDFVKGGIPEGFSRRIREGVMLHRQIDSYTNDHSGSTSARNRFSRERRRFAGIILDICFDHFLIRHWNRYIETSLSSFVDGVFQRIQPYQDIFRGRLPFSLSRENLGYLLETNQDLDGVVFTLSRISNRLRNGTSLLNALGEIEAMYDLLEADFINFFPDLIHYTCSLHPDLQIPFQLNS